MTRKTDPRGGPRRVYTIRSPNGGSARDRRTRKRAVARAVASDRVLWARDEVRAITYVSIDGHNWYPYSTDKQALTYDLARDAIERMHAAFNELWADVLARRTANPSRGDAYTLDLSELFDPAAFTEKVPAGGARCACTRCAHNLDGPAHTPGHE